MRPRARPRGRLAAPLVALVLSLAPAAAQAGGSAARSIDLSHFRVAPGGGYLVTDAATPLAAWDFAVNLYADVAFGGLLVTQDEAGRRGAFLVRLRSGVQLAAALGLFGHAEIGLNALAVPYQAGNLGPIEPATPSLPTSTLGDVVLRAKIAPYPDATFGVALAADVSVPTIGDGAFAGDRAPTVTPWLLLELRAGRFGAALNAGYTIRRSTTVADLEVDDELRLSAGLRFEVVAGLLTALVDGQVRIPTAAPLAGAAVPAEASGALRVTIGSFQLTAGAGAGIGVGYGAPGVRIFVGGGRAPAAGNDPDSDALAGDADRCPLDPEDLDGFQDEDGCPDRDNDGDAVPDGADRCPLDAEDKDGFQDADGCPDLDNDADGLADLRDRCPNAAEDRDGFEDADGCPDLDNDADGIADAADKCPLDAEDRDGFEDADGCPDLDNDADGLPDTADKCPGKPETYNGFDDEDGCPDKGKVLVEVKAERIEIKDKVFFDFNKATIKKKSFKLLDSVAGALKGHADIARVRVEGHTDEVGTRDYNLKLSEERAVAVRAYLVAHGVDAARLEAAGFGFDKPLSPGKTAKDHELNRRVEFVIVERTGAAE